jgi:RNA polymerase sigma-70 factor (ECF subfamily)
VSGAAEAGDETLDLRRELAARHTDAFGFALACCRWDRPEAEDVVQAAYLKVLDGRARFGARSSFRTWLFGVVRTTAAERRRGTWRRIAAWRRSTDLESFARPDSASDADAARLRRELSALPARQREVLHLVFYGELSIAEAAEVMGVALGTARAHYERGKRRLRERLDVGETA